ncbi:MAG: hypothetical protein HC802_02635 [Caldilineaceae bacterium]|nr:hypothetical protein [Caldilineaceae bacterium]
MRRCRPAQPDRARTSARRVARPARLAGQSLLLPRRSATVARLSSPSSGARPCREDAHRQAMRCYVGLGLRTQALRQFQLCTHALQVEFDAMPEPETVQLFEQIRANVAAVYLHD